MKPLQDMGRYATVVVDPPWELQRTGGHLAGKWKPGWEGVTYDTMTIEDIASLPIPDVLGCNARVFCWTTSRFLQDALSLVHQWNTTYSFTMAWIKNRGVQRHNTPCFNVEYIVVSKIGSPQWNDTRRFSLANYWPWAGGSVKPEGFYDLLRRVTPSPRLDIFGRRAIGGFDSWGLEAPTANNEPDIYQDVLLD